MQFISEEATSEFASEAVLLLGLLANYHKYEGRNFYLIRLEDLVDEDLMTRIVKTTTQAMSRCQKYVTLSAASRCSLRDCTERTLTSLTILRPPLWPR